MNKPLPTSLLFQESANGPELKVAEVNLHPGKSISPGQGNRTLLAGGFSSVYPNNSFPLSPTLQLNFDLSSLSQKQLEKIAQAELQRQNQVNYRSYSVEVDSSVCVIGDNAAQLKTFVDTYGGILQLEPLLIKGFDSDIPTATELNFSIGGKRGCLLDFQVRLPVDLEQCIYCGECGTSCPLSCISEDLFIDFSICNFCKECEKVCGTGAIDIHGALGKSLDVAAVILLGGVRIDLPEQNANVYLEDNLVELFATLYPYQVDEIVTCNSEICQYSGRMNHGCKICKNHCKYGAIRLEDEVVIDSKKCEECGACVSVCPTGALQNERFVDSSFVEYFQTLDLPQDVIVVLGDEEALQKVWWRHRTKDWKKLFFLQYENVESLSLFHFLFILNQGVRKVVVVNEFDSETESFSTSALQNQMALGSEIVGKLFDIEDAISSCNVWNIEEVLAQEVAGSIGCSTAIIDFENRRQAVATVLEALVARSGREVEISFAGYIPFATVTCRSGRCTECMACLNDCRIGAMIADSERLELSHIGAMCVGCGLCARVCPEDALVISPEFTLKPDFFNERVLAKAEPMACKTCGKVFGTKKSFEKVMAILKEKEMVDTSHFEHCETCRVVKLFEKDS